MYNIVKEGFEIYLIILNSFANSPLLQVSAKQCIRGCGSYAKDYAISRAACGTVLYLGHGAEVYCLRSKNYGERN